MSVADSGGLAPPMTAQKSFLKSARSGANQSVSTESSKRDIALEWLLDRADLEQLRDALLAEGDGHDNRLSLTKHQLKEFLGIVLRKGNEDQYADFFDKVDSTKTGKIDWHRIADHFFSDFEGRDDKNKQTTLPQWKPKRDLTAVSPHRDVIMRVAFADKLKKYVTISREGVVAMWEDRTFHLSKSQRLVPETIKQRDLWVTDFALMNSLGKFAVASTSKDVCIYDLNTKMELVCLIRVHGFQFTPFCLHFWQHAENANASILTVGDTGGRVIALNFQQSTVTLFERPVRPAGEDKETTLQVDIRAMVESGEQISEKERDSQVCWVSYHCGHTEWVRQVAYIPQLDQFLSCATATDNSLILAPRTVGQMRINETMLKLEGGIHAFDYHVENNLIGIASADRNVYLYNPFVMSKPTGILRGHMTSVIAVQFNPQRGHLISFSKDKVLRVWDVSQQLSLQRIASSNVNFSADLSARLFFHSDRSRLVQTCDAQISIMDLKPEVANRVTSHDATITVAKFLDQNQVISADVLGNVLLWRNDSGNRSKKFAALHDGGDITCLQINDDATRFFTGSNDGTVREFDVTGSVRKKFFVEPEVDESSSRRRRAGAAAAVVKGPTRGRVAEVLAILPLKREFCAVGWEREPRMFRPGEVEDGKTVLPAEWRGGKLHSEDIVAVAFSNPITFATGSLDGEIIVWNLNSHSPITRLNQRVRPRQDKMDDASSLGSRAPSVVPATPAAPAQPAPGEEEGDVYAVSRLEFLECRMRDRKLVANGLANLVSCGAGGWVRVWSTAKSKLRAEFNAHAEVGNIIMHVEQKEGKILVTGDTDGYVKVWNIEGYSDHYTDNIVTDPPECVCQMQAHEEPVTSLDVLYYELEELWLLLTASADLTIRLWHLDGAPIGIFGQEDSWKLKKPSPLEQIDDDDQPDEEDELQSQEASEVTQRQQKLSFEETLNSMTDDQLIELLKRHIKLVEEHENGTDIKLDVWSDTKLGASYSEERSRKRERKQPSFMRNLPYLYSETLGKPQFGPHYSLDTPELTDTAAIPLVKPVLDENAVPVETGPANKNPSPVLRFDISTPPRMMFEEKNLFPRSILQREHEEKQRLLLEQQEAAAAAATAAAQSHIGVHFGKSPSHKTSTASRMGGAATRRQSMASSKLSVTTRR